LREHGGVDRDLGSVLVAALAVVDSLTRRPRFESKQASGAAVQWIRHLDRHRFRGRSRRWERFDRRGHVEDAAAGTRLDRCLDGVGIGGLVQEPALLGTLPLDPVGLGVVAIQEPQ
jgi:hypothetical protein